MMLFVDDDSQSEAQAKKVLSHMHTIHMLSVCLSTELVHQSPPSPHTPNHPCFPLFSIQNKKIYPEYLTCKNSASAKNPELQM